MVPVTCLLLAICLIMNTVINRLKQKKDRKATNPNNSLVKNKASQDKRMVTVPVAIRILRVFAAKSREKVPEITIAVKIRSLRSVL